MPKKITYFLGAGASAQALPTIKWMHLRMKFFHELLKKVHGELGDNPGDLYDLSRDDQIESFLSQIKQAGTPDIVIRMQEIRGESSNLSRQFLSAYIIFEQLNECDDPSQRVLEETEIKEVWSAILKEGGEGLNDAYHFNKLDSRYISLLSTFIDPRSQQNIVDPQISVVTWNYDHQIEKALKLLDEKLLHELQVKHKVVPYTSTNDRDWDFPKIREEYSESRIVKLNGTAGYVPSGNNALFDVTIDKFCKRTWRKLLNLIYGTEMRGATAQKLMLAWDTEYKVAVECRRIAKRIIDKSDIVVLVGYSFPDFNRRVDKEIFSGFQGKLIIQSPDADKLKEKIAGVNPDISQIEIIKEVENFFIPYEFWE